MVKVELLDLDHLDVVVGQHRQHADVVLAHQARTHIASRVGQDAHLLDRH